MMSNFSGFDFLTKPVEEALVPVGKEIGATLSYAWYSAFGAKAQFKGETMKLSVQKDIEDFGKELYSEITVIPPKNLIEPKLSIVGPALEASKYYFEEEDLRNMFTKLVASSADNRKSSYVHPAFVEIIKQMSVIDAQNIRHLKEQSNDPVDCALPIVRYKKEKLKSGGFVTLPQPVERQIILDNLLITQVKDNCINLDSVKINSASLINIQRLGLIEITYDRYLTKFDYQVFTNTEYFTKLQNENQTSDTEYDIEKGYIKFTSLGLDFVKICL